MDEDSCVCCLGESVVERHRFRAGRGSAEEAEGWFCEECVKLRCHRGIRVYSQENIITIMPGWHHFSLGPENVLF
jgi:hypothetical protein